MKEYDPYPEAYVPGDNEYISDITPWWKKHRGKPHITPPFDGHTWVPNSSSWSMLDGPDAYGIETDMGKRLQDYAISTLSEKELEIVSAIHTPPFDRTNFEQELVNLTVGS